MDMTLRKLGRAELVRLLRSVASNLPHASSEVVAVGRRGVRSRIVRVSRDSRGIFLYPLDAGCEKVLALAPLMGSSLHALSIEELADELDKYEDERVWYGWPSDKDPSTVVGKVVGVGKEGLASAILIPVPADIARVNERVRERCAAYGCTAARLGQTCGDCPNVASCPTIERVDREITEESERAGH